MNLNLGSDEEAEARTNELSKTDVASQWHMGLSPAAIVDLLQDGIENDIFYIRAYDHLSSFEVLGAAVEQRAADISQQRPPISHMHPDRDVSRPARAAMRAAREAAKL